MDRDDPVHRFADRADAGRRLASELERRGDTADLVLAIPRGGLPLGREVADEIDVPLDVVVASKIGAPGNPEYAIGAVGSDGTTWLDESEIDRHEIDESYVEREISAELSAAREKAATYRDGTPERSFGGSHVVLVDDGAATGSTAIAAIRLLRTAGVERIVVAVPVAPSATIERLDSEADDVLCLSVPTTFRAVGQFYDRFDQVSDEEAMAYLEN